MTIQTNNFNNRPSIPRRVLDLLGAGVGMVFVAYFMVWILLNWFMGCGEAFYQADGSYLMGDCAPFLPWNFFGPNW
jgi:hypothetical protein